MRVERINPGSAGAVCGALTAALYVVLFLVAALGGLVAFTSGVRIVLGVPDLMVPALMPFVGFLQGLVTGVIGAVAYNFLVRYRSMPRLVVD